MIATALLAVVTGSGTPAPSASTYPTIVHTISSRSCTVLHETIMPIGFVLRKDDDAFGGMSDRLQKIFTDFANQGGAPSREQLMQLGHSNYSNSSGPFALSVDPGVSEDNQLFSPSQVVKASEVASIGNAVRGNLALASQVLNKSLSAIPPGTDAKADEMRARVQALIDLQGSYDDNYEKFVSTYVNNQNVYWAVKPDQQAFVNAYLVALLSGGESSAALSSAEHALSDPARAQIGTIAGVEQQLRQDEQEFGKELIETYNQCSGTHMTP